MIVNYLFCNGDAHLKNYSLLESRFGDFTLSPVYDILNTRIHINEPADIAMKNGLFDGEYTTKNFEVNGFYAYDDFYELGLKAGMDAEYVKTELALAANSIEEVKKLVERSFLSEDMRHDYMFCYNDRRKRLMYSFEKHN
jgi:serine/threonine-protein kinase HipA